MRVIHLPAILLMAFLVTTSVRASSPLSDGTQSELLLWALANVGVCLLVTWLRRRAGSIRTLA
ncbi:hypothetical protein [Sandaracinobacter sp.]|uniref:hypothetical protein n=1 Tax=Sandaracinobacter sp. TaxID=2487581 RepID=UPI0035AD91E1